MLRDLIAAAVHVHVFSLWIHFNSLVMWKMSFVADQDISIMKSFVELNNHVWNVLAKWT